MVGAPEDRLPHLVTFSCLYVDGEALVTELDRRGFEVASGSACTSSALEPSHVLAAMGALTHGNVRVSVGRETTDDDVDRFLAVLPGVLERPAGTPVMLELDCRGLVCPAPVIELARRIGEVAPGELVGVVATDAAARYDVPAWCRMTGQEYVGEETADGRRAALRRTPGQVRLGADLVGGRRRRRTAGSARRTARR